jgi:hypothetical protein
MKPEQERLKCLLRETVRVFINDNVKCHNALCVEGLMGITLDSEVFLVYVNESSESSTGVVGGAASNRDTCSGESSDAVSDECSQSW